MCIVLDATIEVEQGDARNEYASGDKLGLNLPGLQEELLETVAAMGKPVVVLLMAGSASAFSENLATREEVLQVLQQVEQ